VTEEAVSDLLEKRIPGLNLLGAVGREIKISISHPILNDTEGLKQRRVEWDETMRSIVSIGAQKGNQIVGDWLERAARGDISREEMPIAVETLRALCQRSGQEHLNGRANGLPKLIEASASRVD